ncbi:MAG: hypothetical protein ACTJHM_05885 [Agrococcus casei]|uniref:hypothetical protein n=1 Tax=Agrococcus casei TaxID=343512 RepID=UPI003F8DC310
MSSNDTNDWAEQMAEGEESDGSIGNGAEPRASEQLGMYGGEDRRVDSEDTPDGYELRDEEWADDDPADVDVEHGGESTARDTDDNGVDDTVMPEGTDSVIDEY